MLTAAAVLSDADYVLLAKYWLCTEHLVPSEPRLGVCVYHHKDMFRQQQLGGTLLTSA